MQAKKCVLVKSSSLYEKNKKNKKWKMTVTDPPPKKGKIPLFFLFLTLPKINNF